MPESRAISVVIPAFDELPNLRELLPRLRYVLQELGIGAEILVVLPVAVSAEERAEVHELGATPVLRRPTNAFGDAIRSGIAAISPDADTVVIMDADGSHSPETLPRLLAHAAHAHVVVASRYTEGGSSDNALILRVMSRALNIAYGIVLGIRCADVSTNFKAYRASDLRRVSLHCRDFDIVEELLYAVRCLHPRDFTIIEVPDRFHNRNHGLTKRQLGPFVLSYLRTLVRLRRHALGSRP